MANRARKQEKEVPTLLIDPAVRAAEVADLINRLTPSLRETDGADLLVQALARVASCDAAELASATTDVSLRLRLLFYASIGRRPPSDLRSAPTYVSSVQRRYHLPSRNCAREMLASVEGCSSWSALMREALRRAPCNTGD